MEIQDPEFDRVHVREYCLTVMYTYIQLILGSRSRSPKDRDTRRYPPRDETNGDNAGGAYQRRPRHNEGKYSCHYLLFPSVNE